MSSKSKSPKFSLDSSLRFLDRDIKHHTDLTVDEWKVISYIHPANSIRQIAMSTQISTARIESIVEHLLDLGIVERFSDTEDEAINHEKSRALSFTYTNTDSVQDILADWYLRVVKNQQAHYLLSSQYRSLHYWLGIPTILFSGAIGSTLLTGSSDETVKTILGILSLVVTCLTALQTFLRSSEQAEKHKLAAAQLGGIRREIDKLRAFPGAMPEQKDLLDKIKEHIDKTTQEAPDLPINIWSRLEKKEKQLSLVNKLISRIRSL